MHDIEKMMPDLKKVIRGLECCILRDPDDHARCRECPYNYHEISNSPCANGLKRDALELLKAREPRVLTLEGVQASEDCMEPVFLEMLDENGKSGDAPDIFSWRFVKHITTITGSKIFVLNNTEFSSALYAETYNLTWRCWTSRPTDEQREEIPWN